jgi:hypothetical protein
MKEKAINLGRAVGVCMRLSVPRSTFEHITPGSLLGVLILYWVLGLRVFFHAV